MIEVLTSGQLNAVQDGGRAGYLEIGVSHAGAMDRLALTLGNTLIGNPAGAAAIEVAYFPFRVRLEADLDIAITGADCAATLDGRPLPPCWAIPAKAGQVLSLSRPLRGARAYLCVAGGIDVPDVLGSKSTDQKNGFGGLEGRGLNRGDRLAVGARDRDSRLKRDGVGAWIEDLAATSGDPSQSLALRVLPAAQFGDFPDAMIEAFFATDWLLTPEANRMGYRFSGPTLKLKAPMELLSHGIMPGTVQVPPAGQPIIQLADANTCGGYPKIANVIEADLWRLGQLPVGRTVRFVEVSRDEALAAWRLQNAALAELEASLSG